MKTQGRLKLDKIIRVFVKNKEDMEWVKNTLIRGIKRKEDSDKTVIIKVKDLRR